MHKSFISKVVIDVLNNHKNLNELTFVLPSSRACVFLKEELKKNISITSFFPKIQSVEYYIQELADIQLIDNTQLLFEFYGVYKQTVPKEKIEPFEMFCQWAIRALQDFNEIDSSLVNPKDLFTNLRDIKKLNVWFKNKKPSKLATNYLQFFDDLQNLYFELNANLKKEKFGYQGLIYKEAVENLEFYIQNNSQKHTIFVGFNALNKAEEYIFQELLNNNIATCYWDANQMIMDKSNEAGTFLRKYKNQWNYYKNNPFLWDSHKEISSQNINIVGAPKNITQIKYAGELLSKLDDFSKTAFVLADENLLSLTLNSLPKNVKNLNITMGYPLKDIPVANLFESVFQLHLNQKKLDKEKSKQFYYKDILSLFNSPFLYKLDENIIKKILVKIKKENRLFLTLGNLKEGLSKDEIQTVSVVFSLFSISKNINDIICQFVELINIIKTHEKGVEKEYLFRFYQVFKQLEFLNSKYNHITDLKTLALFYNQILKNEKLSFQGEPLQGLQLMGMLETRALDFETIIITSVNEGILPKGKNSQSYIPYDVKKHFSMPTYSEKDAIFSYHFKRLLCRAKNVYLLYNTETDGYGSGEKSRFLTQLEIQNDSISESIISPKAENIEFPIIEIKKTPEIIHKLNELFKRGISPSSLSTYLTNPLTFYERKILGIRDDDTVEETIEANTMGTIVHEVLENIYKPYINKFLTLEDLDNCYKQINNLLKDSFKTNYKKGSFDTGKNKIIFEICRKYLQDFLIKEKNLLSNAKNRLKILALEKKLETTINLKNINFPIKFSGTVDRIDMLNGTTRIIDYKTGKVDNTDLKLNDFSKIHDSKKYNKVPQVMLYSFMFDRQKNKYNSLEAGIISFKNLNANMIKMNFSEKNRGNDFEITKVRIEEFMIEIEKIIVEILNPEIPFIQNPDSPY